MFSFSTLWKSWYMIEGRGYLKFESLVETFKSICQSLLFYLQEYFKWLLQFLTNSKIVQAISF